MLALGERESESRRGSPGSSAGERRSTMLERQSRLDRALLCSAAYPVAGGTAARYSGVPRCPPLQMPRGVGRPPPDLPPSPPPGACRLVGLTVGHLGAVDGIEAAAPRRPDGAAAVGLQDSERRVPARPSAPQGQRDASPGGKVP